jgi:predicted AlkP superfamily phosphohydrolase/phosphomutase
MTARQRLFVLGLDGVPLSLALRLAPQLPNLGRIASQARTVDAELPELSPVNWTSLATGRGPEEHGIFGFSRLHPDTFEVHVASAEHVTCPTIFDHLDRHELVSRVVNLPNTYPVRPLRGMMIAGFVAEDWEQAVYPPYLGAALKGYRLEADTSQGLKNPTLLLEELHTTLKWRERALDLLWPDLDWDLFVFVLTETDRLFHFLYPALEEPAHPWHAPCLELMLRWDQLLGRTLEYWDALPEPKRLMVMADHGFTTLRTEVDINAWLRQNDLLHLSAPPIHEWDASVVSPSSAAFALDPGRIYLNTKKRFSRGSLSEQAARLLLPQIKQGLESLTYQGERVMEQVFTGQQLYPGPQKDRAPDLVCLARPGFDCKAKFDRTQLFGLYGRTGTHTARGAIFYDSQGCRPRRMRDIGAEILRHFNVPGPTPEQTGPDAANGTLSLFT